MKMPKNTFQNLDKGKQERIARVATEEFSLRGYAGASINTIVKRLNIAKGSIFQYFGDKQGLFWFVFQRSVDVVKIYLKGVREDTRNDDLATRLKKTLNTGVRFINDHPLIYRLYLHVFFESRAPFRDEILCSLRQYSLEYLTSLLEDAKANGELNESINLPQAAFILDAVMDRFLQANILKHLDASLGLFELDFKHADHLIDGIIEILVTGIGSRKLVHGKIPPAPVLILSATEAEIETLLIKIKTNGRSAICGKTFFSGGAFGIPINLMITGPGKVNTSQGLSAILEHHTPELILQTGWAGAFPESGLAIGDVAIATEEIDGQLGVESETEAEDMKELPFELVSTGKGIYKNRFPLNEHLAEKVLATLQMAFKAAGIKIAKGPFVTVSTITATPHTTSRIYNQYQACVEQMEGAASAQVAVIYDIPYLEIRSVSNMVGERNKKNWDTKRASESLSEAIYAIISNYKDIISAVL